MRCSDEGMSRRALLGGIGAAALASGCRTDMTSWLVRDHFDVDYRFLQSTRELPPPSGPPIRQGEAWSMLIIADIHCWDEVPCTMDEIRGYLDREPTDFLFCLGDVTEASTDSEYDLALCALEGLGIPYYCTIGNHDTWWEGWIPYRELFGPSVYELRGAGSVFLVLDTAGATLGGLQRPWLEERLAASADAEHLFVLTHYPLWTSRQSQCHQMASQEEEYAILDLLRRHGADAHLSGHTHRWASNEIGGVRLVSVSATRESAPDRTALRVDVDGGAVTYTRIPLGTT